MYSLNILSNYDKVEAVT